MTSTLPSTQNLTLPTGSAKLGETEYRVSLNSSPEAIEALNDVPIRLRDGRTILLRDIAHVHDGYAVQTSIARQDGKRAVVLSVLKTGEASTVEVAQRIRSMLPGIKAAAPPGLRMELLADQSTFVTRAIEGLLFEGLIAAALTATMILLFLGSWRSTVIVFVSIPLSVLIAVLAMRLLGQTINTMTLGGLALAVGILVDDATVEIENIHRNIGLGKPLTKAILDGAQQIAVPAFVASLSIGLVFFSVFLLEGPARYLFAPLGMAVGFSVMASYLLSRTIVPTLVKYLLPAEIAAHHAPRRGLFTKLHDGFNAGFERFRGAYVVLLDMALAHRWVVVGVFALSVTAAALLSTRVGREFFPQVDGGQLRFHVTAPPGTRIEETERYFGEVERVIRETIPEHERELILDQIGMPQGYSLAVTDSSNVSTADGEILVRLAHHRSRPTREYIAELRKRLPREFPELSFYFQPADIVTQILNFGLPSPISITVTGVKRAETYRIAQGIEHDLRGVPGAVDVRIHQIVNAPGLRLEVDRVRASEVGLSQRDVASDVLLAVSSSGQVSPNYWTDPVSGNSYPVVVQIPEREIDSLEELLTLGVASPRGTQLLGDLVNIKRRATPVFTSHTDVQPTYEVRADVQNADLGSVAKNIDSIVANYTKQLPPGAAIEVRGQVKSMRSAFVSLALGLFLASFLVYGLMVVNFQSWLDPFIILLALPGAGMGIVFALFLTGTHVSVPSLMGAVMSIGVATANSTLLISFANEVREHGATAKQAALEAGRARLRPILMTALAMGIGMLPMSLGLGEGGEQNASLARAVLGGLSGATFATLFFVPIAFSFFRARERVREPDPYLDEPGDRSQDSIEPPVLDMPSHAGAE
ncbi:MAG: efflux RND transporter permease subunit [Polyangiaceae bacterium]